MGLQSVQSPGQVLAVVLKDTQRQPGEGLLFQQVVEFLAVEHFVATFGPSHVDSFVVG